MQLRDGSLRALCERYVGLRHGGVEPRRATDRGPATSFYYSDPDGNAVELAASNFATAEETAAAFNAGYRDNPAGHAVDAAAIAERVLGSG